MAKVVPMKKTSSTKVEPVTGQSIKISRTKTSIKTQKPFLVKLVRWEFCWRWSKP